MIYLRCYLWHLSRTELLTILFNLQLLLFQFRTGRSEAELIMEIVADISKCLNCALLKNAQNLVGMDSCIRELEPLLCLEWSDVRMVGIWGMGGIG